MKPPPLRPPEPRESEEYWFVYKILVSEYKFEFSLSMECDVHTWVRFTVGMKQLLEDSSLVYLRSRSSCARMYPLASSMVMCGRRLSIRGNGRVKIPRKSFLNPIHMLAIGSSISYQSRHINKCFYPREEIGNCTVFQRRVTELWSELSRLCLRLVMKIRVYFVSYLIRVCRSKNSSKHRAWNVD